MNKFGYFLKIRLVAILNIGLDRFKTTISIKSDRIYKIIRILFCLSR